MNVCVCLPSLETECLEGWEFRWLSFQSPCPAKCLILTRRSVTMGEWMNNWMHTRCCARSLNPHNNLPETSPSYTWDLRGSGRSQFCSPIFCAVLPSQQAFLEPLLLSKGALWLQNLSVQKALQGVTDAPTLMWGPVLDVALEPAPCPISRCFYYGLGVAVYLFCNYWKGKGCFWKTGEGFRGFFLCILII